jgi:hypothetical protein
MFVSISSTTWILDWSVSPGTLGLDGLQGGIFCDPGGRGGKPIADSWDFQLGIS